jgi:hypothetical protein
MSSAALVPAWLAAETQRKLEICAAIFANLCIEKHAINRP